MDTIYRFEYYNLQGNKIEVQFIPNVCSSSSPQEVFLIENIFEIGRYTFGFEKDYIKDKVCGSNAVTLEVEVNFQKLNRLALESEHYMLILKCLLDYKYEYKRESHFSDSHNIYNVFIIKIDGLELPQSVYCQRDIYGSLTDNGSLTLTDILSTALLDLDFKKYYEKAIDTTLLAGSELDSGSYRNVPVLWQWFCNNSDSIIIDNAFSDELWSLMPHAVGLFPIYNPFGGRFSRKDTDDLNSNKSKSFYGIKGRVGSGEGDAFYNDVLYNNYGIFQLVKLERLLSSIYQLAFDEHIRFYPFFSNYKINCSSILETVRFYKQSFDGTGESGNILGSDSVYVCTGGIAPVRKSAGIFVYRPLFGYVRFNMVSYRDYSKTFEKLDFSNLQEYIESVFMSFGIWCYSIVQRDGVWVQNLTNTGFLGASELDIANSNSNQISINDRHSRINVGRSDQSDNINLTKYVNEDIDISNTDSNEASVDEVYHNSICQCLAVERFSLCENGRTDLTGEFGASVTPFMGLKPSNNFQYNTFAPADNRTEGYVRDKVGKMFDCYSYYPKEWNELQLYYIEDDPNIVNIPSAFSVSNSVLFRKDFAGTEIKNKAILGSVDFIEVAIGTSISASIGAEHGFNRGLGSDLAGRIAINNSLVNCIIKHISEVQRNCITQQISKNISNENRMRYILECEYAVNYSYGLKVDFSYLIGTKYKILNTQIINSAIKLYDIEWFVLGLEFDYNSSLLTFKLIGDCN